MGGDVEGGVLRCGGGGGGGGGEAEEEEGGDERRHGGVAVGEKGEKILFVCLGLKKMEILWGFI